MTKFLLSVHVLAAILAIGPVTVAAGAFPASTRRALAAPGGEREVAVLRGLHRTCRVYAAVGIAVPVFGLATANSLGVLGDAWLITSIALTALAAAVLVLLVLPRQAALLDDVVASRRPRWPPSRLAMHTGLFNLLWTTVTVLMVVRPGSTTGA
ncbi:hypothetical protein AB0G02_28480 [Actinosynnema sp. NPDC023658]|uniref:hypothetical protein n=1 Tax=Actinosynnema sp. NPDC023658 TaxID=3155465 RepID=UPI00340431F9